MPEPSKPSLPEARAAALEANPDGLLHSIADTAERGGVIPVTLHVDGLTISGFPCSRKEWSEASVDRLGLTPEQEKVARSYYNFDPFPELEISAPYEELSDEQYAEHLGELERPFMHFKDATIMGPGNAFRKNVIIRVRLANVSAWETPTVTNKSNSEQ